MIACACGRKFQRYRFPVHCACGQVIHSPNGRSASESHWVPLHQYAVDHANDWDANRAQAWFVDWCKRIPGGCDCERKWAKYCDSNPPRFSNPDEFFGWGVEAHNYVSTHHASPAKLPMSVFDAKARYMAAAGLSLVQHVITYDEWTRDTLTLSQLILENHPDVSGIAGCPRSGMRAACDVALRLGVPLYQASHSAGLLYIGGGSRIRNTDIHGERKTFSGPVVIVDDSTCSGFAVRELKQTPELAKLPIYVIYAASPGRHSVDGYVRHLELPHWFDWNLFNNGQILRQQCVGTDFDGVLCSDCSPEDDDDGPRYTQWMESVRPIRMPRDYPIPFIVTARREAYREITEAWLGRHRINYGQLVMFPGTFKERSQAEIGQWKARQCDRLGVGLFIESDYHQSLRIAELRQRPVISIGARARYDITF